MEEEVFSSGSELPWYWIIETLSKSNFDGVTSLLFELVAKAPPSNSDSEKKAREAIALRCLEELSKGSSGSSNGGVPFDLSESCADVLQRILDENSVHDVENDVSNELKWDIRSFVERKKASMPPTTLESLKNMIVEGANPLAASLKEISGIGLPNKCQSGVPSGDTKPTTIPTPNGNSLPSEKYASAVVDDTYDCNIDGALHGMNDHGFRKKHRVYHRSKKQQSVPNSEQSNGVHEPKMNLDDLHLPKEIDFETKLSFFSSQHSLDEDSLTLADSMIHRCMKCNKGGQLLICSSPTCPLAVHESCLGCSATFDDQGCFYCPFCAYSRAIAEYVKAKKKAALARQELSLFIEARNGCKRAVEDGGDTGEPQNHAEEVTQVDGPRELWSSKGKKSKPENGEL